MKFLINFWVMRTIKFINFRNYWSHRKKFKRPEGINIMPRGRKKVRKGERLVAGISGGLGGAVAGFTAAMISGSLLSKLAVAVLLSASLSAGMFLLLKRVIKK